MAMDLGDAKLTLKAEDKTKTAFGEIEKSTNKMSANFKKAGLAITAMGVGLAIALGKMVTSYAKAGDEVAKMAKRTGFGTEALSELRHVAGLAGTDLGSIEKAAKKMSKTLVDASEGMTTYIRAFDRIGLSAEELMKLSPEEQFWAIAEAISKLENQAIKAATAVDIFGRAGTMLIPMLDMTTEELAAARQEAHDLGLVFDAEAAAAAEKFQDALLSLKGSMTGIMHTIADELMPVLTEHILKITEAIKGIIEWTKEHPRLTKALVAFLGVMTALTITGGPMLLFIGFLPQIKAGILMVAGVLTKTLIPAIIRTMASLIAMLAAMGPAGWAMIAAGVVAAGLAITGLIQYLKGVGENAALIGAGEELGVPIVAGAKGGLVTRPTLALLGERGPEAVVPLAGGAGAINPQSITIHIGNFMGDESSLRAFSRKVKEIIGQDTRRTSFSGINRLEYFPGSSAP